MCINDPNGAGRFKNGAPWTHLANGRWLRIGLIWGGGSNDGVSSDAGPPIPEPGDCISPYEVEESEKASFDSIVGENNPVGSCPFRRNHPENTPPPPTCLCTCCLECVRAIADWGIAEGGGRSLCTWRFRFGEEACNRAMNRGDWRATQTKRIIVKAYIILRGVVAVNQPMIGMIGMIGMWHELDLQS